MGPLARTALQKGLIARILLASLILQVVGLGVQTFSGILVDGVLPTKDTSLLGMLGVALAVAGVVHLGLTCLRAATVLKLRLRADRLLTTEVVGHLFRLPYRYFATRGAGDLAQRSASVSRLRQLISGPITTAPARRTARGRLRDHRPDLLAAAGAVPAGAGVGAGRPPAHHAPQAGRPEPGGAVGAGPDAGAAHRGDQGRGDPQGGGHRGRRAEPLVAAVHGPAQGRRTSRGGPRTWSPRCSSSMRLLAPAALVVDGRLAGPRRPAARARR